MLRSMFSAISGLRAHQTKMDVTGNNIANVNTIGFKSSTTVFEDTLSQVLTAGGGPAQGRGGTNPAQVGLGVKLAGISTNFSQGAAQSTGRTTDFMIEGDGFFVTRAGTEQLYTRAGSFSFDATGNLVTPGGSVLQGWTAVNGVVNANGPIGDLAVPFGQVIPPVATTTGDLVGNLSAGVPVGTNYTSAITMFDGQGNAQQMSYVLTKAAAAADWTLDIVGPASAVPLSTTTLTFSAAGVLTAPAGGTATFTPGAGYPSWPGAVVVDIAGLTNFGGQPSVSPTQQNGSALGTLQSFSLGNDGTITGVYSNSLRQAIGKLAMASFNNPGGLEKAGSSGYRVGDNSGVAQIGQAGTAGRGVLSSGKLEMSNVDLAEEFTSLIVAQRGFQANSRVISSSDEILQDLVNLKR